MILTLASVTISCAESTKQETKTNYEDLTKQYAKVQLTSDISHLSDNEKHMLKYLFEVGRIMDDIFWTQNYGGDKETFLNSIEDDNARLFAEINYGPWNHFDNLASFLPEYGEMPQGAGFYPADMTKEEFEAWDNPDKTSQYTLIKRDENGKLQAVWFHEAYAEQVKTASDLLMMVVRSLFRLRNPSMFINAFIASGLASKRFKVSLSTLTSNADSQRLANSVADVPAKAISRMSWASTSFMLLPS